MTKLIWILAVVCVLVGCSDAETNRGDMVLIQVRDVVVTVSDFTQAFEIFNAGYDTGDTDQRDGLNEARLALLNQMTEEVLLLVKARELGIDVSPAELEAAVQDIKADYPKGEFEQALLEYAVPYRFWEKRLKTRLLMEKVIAQELGRQITITPEDIAAYYQAHYANQEEEERPEKEQAPADQINKEPGTDNLEASIIKQLRREKTEIAYGPWIQKLKDEYPVEINKQEWEHIIGS
jgi:hypothetical protein